MRKIAVFSLALILTACAKSGGKPDPGPCGTQIAVGTWINYVSHDSMKLEASCDGRRENDTCLYMFTWTPAVNFESTFTIVSSEQTREYDQTGTRRFCLAPGVYKIKVGYDTQNQQLVLHSGPDGANGRFDRQY